ncbi:MAG: ScpA family protein [Hyphomonadaceae bacterium]
MTIEAEEDIAFEAEEEGQALSLALDGFEGPLSLLLELARAHKVDLARISISALADQYLDYVAAMRAARMDLAADYLVMASWLALLKSRLILPHPVVVEDAPDPEQMAEALRRKLMRLEEARAAAKRLMQLPQLGRDFFAFGDPRPIAIEKHRVWRADLMELLSAYCREATKHVRREHKLKPRRAYPLADARHRLEKLLAEIEEWKPIEAVTPAAEKGPDAPPPASYLASMLGAALELAREAKVELKQEEAFAPLYLRARHEGEAAP